MSEGLSTALARTRRTSASVPDMFQHTQGKFYWSKDSLEFCNKKNAVIMMITITDAPVTLVDSY